MRTSSPASPAPSIPSAAQARGINAAAAQPSCGPAASPAGGNAPHGPSPLGPRGTWRGTAGPTPFSAFSGAGAPPGAFESGGWGQPGQARSPKLEPMDADSGGTSRRPASGATPAGAAATPVPGAPSPGGAVAPGTWSLGPGPAAAAAAAAVAGLLPGGAFGGAPGGPQPTWPSAHVGLLPADAAALAAGLGGGVAGWLLSSMTPAALYLGQLLVAARATSPRRGAARGDGGSPAGSPCAGSGAAGAGLPPLPSPQAGGRAAAAASGDGGKGTAGGNTAGGNTAGCSAARARGATACKPQGVLRGAPDHLVARALASAAFPASPPHSPRASPPPGEGAFAQPAPRPPLAPRPASAPGGGGVVSRTQGWGVRPRGPCANCGALETSLWRRDPTRPWCVLCNICGIYVSAWGDGEGAAAPLPLLYITCLHLGHRPDTGCPTAHPALSPPQIKQTGSHRPVDPAARCAGYPAAPPAAQGAPAAAAPQPLGAPLAAAAQAPQPLPPPPPSFSELTGMHHCSVVTGGPCPPAPPPPTATETAAPELGEVRGQQEEAAAAARANALAALMAADARGGAGGGGAAAAASQAQAGPAPAPPAAGDQLDATLQRVLEALTGGLRAADPTAVLSCLLAAAQQLPVDGGGGAGAAVPAGTGPAAEGARGLPPVRVAHPQAPAAAAALAAPQASPGPVAGRKRGASAGGGEGVAGAGEERAPGTPDKRRC
jgi:hypothetical protein